MPLELTLQDSSTFGASSYFLHGQAGCPALRCGKRTKRGPFFLVLAGRKLALEAGMAERRKNPHAMALGRLGGLKGGRARAEKLSARRRREIARQAALARWSPD